MLLTDSDQDPRRLAMLYYWQGYRITRIAEFLGEKPSTIHSWKRRDGWDNYSPLQQVEYTTAARYNRLVTKDKKEAADYKEIDLLGRQMERHARIGRFGETGKASDLNPNIERRTEERKKPTRNHFSEEQAAEMETYFHGIIRPYQLLWYENRHHPVRAILKTRQCGASWYFAREALLDAVQTGKNKIFLSASRSQVMVFRREIVKVARQFGVKLTGNPIILSNGAEIHFLSTNASTAQSYNGDLYVDEFFWISGFAQVQNTASGMATLDDMHITYLSTPSTYSHEAYPFWSGDAYNRDRPKAERVDIPLTHEALKGGLMCADGIWRHMLTIDDAVAQGMKATPENLQRLNTATNYANKYLCQFLDDTESVFPLKVLRGCMVDSMISWRDFRAYAPRPFGDHPVWIGYDPSSTGDSCGCVVVAPPRRPGEAFRILERFQWHEPVFQVQADKIKALTERYNVTHIGIDETGGMGRAVAQMVKVFFPQVESLHYNTAMKIDLVMKARSVIDAGRLKFDFGHNDIAQAFMAIRKIVTPSGKYVSYETSRAEGISHGDVAWATMHALIHEPMSGYNEATESFMEIY
ncbi:terminase family protein [Salmonella enterica]|nr:oxidoreductase [Salmonella enterica subsp. diarizonae]ELB6470227.1 terminase family protein [Salmonella enterica]